MRLDTFLVESNKFKSRNKASESIQRGEIKVNSKVVTKPAFNVIESDLIEIIYKEEPFVSIGGNKLKRAIEKLNPSICNKVFIDVGASTGGFTDCLLRNGAKKVYCVDVGNNLLDAKIANDSRVIVMDNTNARYLKPADFQELVDAIVIDCSFISLEYILPPLIDLLNEDGYILALIKPQFELQERINLKNGILRNDKEREKILKRLYDFCIQLNLIPKGLTCVTVDTKKNLEYIFLISKKGLISSFEDILI